MTQKKNNLCFKLTLIVIVLITILTLLIIFICCDNSKNNSKNKENFFPVLCANSMIDSGNIPMESSNQLLIADKYNQYLKEKLTKALRNNLIDHGAGGYNDVNFPASNEFGLGLYIKNSPIDGKPVKVWANWKGGTKQAINNINLSDSTKGEIGYYFGSGTKPLTAAMVVSKIFKLWRKKNPNIDANEFLAFYAGDLNNPGSPPAVTYKDLFSMTDGFKNSNYIETLVQPSNTQNKFVKSNIEKTQKIQDWLFCCPNGGLIKSCTANTGLFCSNSCQDICPVALDHTTYGGNCQSPFCPDSICDWAWYSDYTKTTPAKLDPNSQKFKYKPTDCTCPVIKPDQYQNIFQNLSIFNVAMMRSGIPDSDSIWGIDTSAQLSSRTRSIGPVEFVSEIIGFDWDPGWIESSQVVPIWNIRERFRFKPNKIRSSVNVKSYVPKTKSLYPSINAKINTASSKPAAQYSSSAFTFLGILLWLLDENIQEKNWKQINLNSILPLSLQSLINFGGTGLDINNYWIDDPKGNKYYSFEKTIDNGGVSHPDIQDDTPISNIQTDCSGQPCSSDNIMNVQTYEREIVQDTGKNASSPVVTRFIKFVDWDASSGISCGNTWGKCSNMAEIYMNILSPNADNPIMGGEIQKYFVEEFLDYNGKNTLSMYKNKLQAPYCAKVNAWSQGSTYNHGVMGPDWFFITDNTEHLIPCYGHLGATYGFDSCHIYFPGGKIKPYPPMKGIYRKNWSLTFDFCKGSEFTLSCAQNSSLTQSSGPIQNFIKQVLKDPFNFQTGTWNK